MQKTTNYQLPKWEKTDRILMDDFNGMTAALDTALKTNADAVTAETTARENAMTAEAAERANADAALQSAINGKAASSHTHAQSDVAGLTAAMAAKGNCRIQTGSYTGTGVWGESNKNTIACSGVPLLLCVLAAAGEGVLLAAGSMAKGLLLRGGNHYTMNMTWNSGSVQWYFNGNHTDTIGYQLNNTGWVYHYILLYQAD